MRRHSACRCPGVPKRTGATPNILELLHSPASICPTSSGTHQHPRQPGAEEQLRAHLGPLLLPFAGLRCFSTAAGSVPARARGPAEAGLVRQVTTQKKEKKKAWKLLMLSSSFPAGGGAVSQRAAGADGLSACSTLWAEAGSWESKPPLQQGLQIPSTLPELLRLSDSLTGFAGHWHPCCLCDYSSFESIALPARSLTFPEAPQKSPSCCCLLSSLCPGFFGTPMPQFSIAPLETSLVTAVTAAELPGVRSSRRLLPGVQAPATTAAQSSPMWDGRRAAMV